MRMPKLPPNAADYGVRDNIFCIGVDMPNIRTELLIYDAETIRQFAACMEVGWRRIADASLPDTDAWCEADLQAAKWAEWGAKHAPVSKTD